MLTKIAHLQKQATENYTLNANSRSLSYPEIYRTLINSIVENSLANNSIALKEDLELLLKHHPEYEVDVYLQTATQYLNNKNPTEAFYIYYMLLDRRLTFLNEIENDVVFLTELKTIQTSLKIFLSHIHISLGQR